ncbi:MAG: hypothetical protein CR967_04825 [Proteobacteria bacterium]|nr:MAG: hypothetical protein CR967_04825 [Pseudomonadota bacterium]
MLESFSSQTAKSISELIGLSIAPVFMLAGTSGFLNVLTGRLARIIDRIEKINSLLDAKKSISSDKMQKLQTRKKVLKKRMKNINQSILFMTATGLLVAVVMVTMFVSFLFGSKDSILISLIFIMSMLFLIVSLVLFSREIIYTVNSAEIDV